MVTKVPIATCSRVPSSARSSRTASSAGGTPPYRSRAALDRWLLLRHPHSRQRQRRPHLRYHAAGSREGGSHRLFADLLGELDGGSDNDCALDRRRCAAMVPASYVGRQYRRCRRLASVHCLYAVGYL